MAEAATDVGDARGFLGVADDGRIPSIFVLAISLYRGDRNLVLCLPRLAVRRF